MNTYTDLPKNSKNDRQKHLRNIFSLAAIMTPIAAILMSLPTSALSISSSRDCDSNAVINCGALTVNELQRKFNNQSSVRTIFRSFGISASDIRAMDSTARAGTVTRSGKVMVNGKTVATHAMTAGRQNMSGSQSTTRSGVTFFERRPSVSFAQSSLPAFVVMNNGRFQFAIIASCGNPVKATPMKKVVKKHVRVPTPAPVAPTAPTPRAKAPRQSQMQSQSQSQQQSQSQSVTVTTPVVKQRTVTTTAPAPQPAPTPVPQKVPAPTQIPNTGGGDVVGFGSFVTLVSGGLHYLYRRRFSS